MIDGYASMPHYADHVNTVLAALPENVRGQMALKGEGPVLVASYRDHRAVRREGRTAIVMEHGAGQSYSDSRPEYAGGRDRGDAALFLAPNHHAASRWSEAYPGVPVEVVGNPRLDHLPAREPGEETVAVTFHWDCRAAPEARNAERVFRSALPALAKEFRLIGHAHPRANLAGLFKSRGIEWVPDFAEVCRRADLLVFDNTSVGFEFAATGRPVVVLNAPWYSRNANHGLRFWDAATVGLQVDDPARLVEMVRAALRDTREMQRRREQALALVYPVRSGGAQLAADAIVRHVC
ncbi:MAG TPA: CDP-glycerol glycerophosphotransferase family protein [Actinomycetota bacterium]